MQSIINVLTLTAISAGLFEAYDLVGFDDQKVTADDAPVKGFAMNPSTEVGLPVAVVAVGTARVKARGAIAKGAKLVSAAAGGVKAAGATPANAFATALHAAADGEFVEILVR